MTNMWYQFKGWGHAHITMMVCRKLYIVEGIKAEFVSWETNFIVWEKIFYWNNQLFQFLQSWLVLVIISYDNHDRLRQNCKKKMFAIDLYDLQTNNEIGFWICKKKPSTLPQPITSYCFKTRMVVGILSIICIWSSFVAQ